LKDPSPRGPRRALLAVAVGLAVSALLLWLLLRRVDVDAVLSAMGAARALPLAVSLGVKLAGFGALAWRLRALLGPVVPLAGSRALSGQLLGFAANNLIPLRAGELVKVDYVARRAGCSRASVLAVAAVERLLDAICVLAMLVLVGPLAVPRLERHEAVLGAGCLVLAAALGAWWAAGRSDLLGRAARRIEAALGLSAGGRLARAADSFGLGLAGLRSGRVLAAALGASGLYWACAFVSVRLWIAAFSLPVPWYAPAVVLVFLAFGTALPASPGFVGAYDYFFAAALGLFGVGPDRAAAAALVGHALAVVPFTLLGLVLVPGSVGAFRATMDSVLSGGSRRP
jgi:hypothetical protein